MTESQKKILWIDDDEHVLSGIGRFARTLPWTFEFATDPEKALKLIESQEFAVIISDQRMPKLSGVEFLVRAEEFSPCSTRMLVTGYLDESVIEEGLNRARVFRFITKPWNEEDLTLDIRRAVEHYEYLTSQESLRRQIIEKNRELENLTQGLESVVEARTESIGQSKLLLEEKQKRTRAIIQTIKDLSQITFIEEVAVLLRRELKKFSHIREIFLAYVRPDKSRRIVHFSGSSLSEKKALEGWTASTRLRDNENKDRQYLASVLERPMAKILAIPLDTRKGENPVLFIEHSLSQEEMSKLMDWLTERIQPLSTTSDRVLLSEQLILAAKQWERTFDSIGEPVAIVDNEYQVRRANSHFFKKEKAPSCYKSLFGRDVPCFGCPLIEAMSKDDPQIGQIVVDARVYRVFCFPIKGKKQTTATNAVTYYMDITEDRSLYGQLIQNEKMAALGRLAGSIAHELNNPLTGIRSLSQVLRSEISETSRSSEDLREIEKAAERSQTIIKNFLEFSSTSPEEQQKIVSLNDIIEKTLPLLKTAFRELRREIELTDSDVRVRVNPSLIQQVIFNLVNNACQAMGQGGQLNVRTVIKNKMVELEVEDNGPGIDPQVLGRVFEPFFTTKPVGHGTGLGLSLSKTIVEKSGGTIKIDSKLGEGTRVTVSLPQIGSSLDESTCCGR